MPRRLLLRSLLLLVGLSMVGCEMVPKAKGRPHAAETTDEILPNADDAEKDGVSGGKSFFKNTRLKGGLSSEANAIERELGVRN